ncbi:MAG: hypothetical protein N3D82_03325 [Ignisphaera sp.]|nr:hypothetical protein [Ignisphaera sp.]
MEQLELYLKAAATASAPASENSSALPPVKLFRVVPEGRFL